MSGDAEGFHRIHERHGDVQREGWQVNQALAREQNYQGIFGGCEFQYGNSDLGPGAVTAWGNGHCTWLHPMVAIHLAMWISAEFAVKVMDWTFRFIIGDLTLVEDLVECHEAVNVGAHVKATVTASSPRTETQDIGAYLTRFFGTCEISPQSGIPQSGIRLGIS